LINHFQLQNQPNIEFHATKSNFMTTPIWDFNAGSSSLGIMSHFGATRVIWLQSQASLSGKGAHLRAEYEKGGTFYCEFRAVIYGGRLDLSPSSSNTHISHARRRRCLAPGDEPILFYSPGDDGVDQITRRSRLLHRLVIIGIACMPAHSLGRIEPRAENPLSPWGVRSTRGADAAAAGVDGIVRPSEC
jgi:hypothetical protein